MASEAPKRARFSAYEEAIAKDPVPHAPFCLETAVLLAGYAFEVYNEPVDAVWDVGRDGTKVAFLSESFVREVFCGVLQVSVLRADGVPLEQDRLEALATGGFADAYVTLALDDGRLSAAPQRTTPRRNVAAPEWNEFFLLYVADPADAMLRLALKDSNAFKEDKLLATANVSVSTFLSSSSSCDDDETGDNGDGGSWTGWVELEPATESIATQQVARKNLATQQVARKNLTTRIRLDVRYTPFDRVSPAELIAGGDRGDGPIPLELAAKTPAGDKAQGGSGNGGGGNGDGSGGGVVTAAQAAVGRLPSNSAEDGTGTAGAVSGSKKAYREAGVDGSSSGDDASGDTETSGEGGSGCSGSDGGLFSAAAVMVAMADDTVGEEARFAMGEAVAAAAAEEALAGPKGGTPGIDWRKLTHSLGGFALAARDLEPVCFLDNSDTDTQVGVWRDVPNKRLVVSFRGTQGNRWRDVLTDANAVLEPLDGLMGSDAGIGLWERRNAERQLREVTDGLAAARDALPEQLRNAVGLLPGVAASLGSIGDNLDRLRQEALSGGGGGAGGGGAAGDGAEANGGFGGFGGILNGFGSETAGKAGPGMSSGQGGKSNSSGGGESSGGERGAISESGDNLAAIAASAWEAASDGSRELSNWMTVLQGSIGTVTDALSRMLTLDDAGGGLGASRGAGSDSDGVMERMLRAVTEAKDGAMNGTLNAEVQSRLAEVHGAIANVTTAATLALAAAQEAVGTAGSDSGDADGKATVAPAGGGGDSGGEDKGEALATMVAMARSGDLPAAFRSLAAVQESLTDVLRADAVSGAVRSLPGAAEEAERNSTSAAAEMGGGADIAAGVDATGASVESADGSGNSGKKDLDVPLPARPTPASALRRRQGPLEWARDRLVANVLRRGRGAWDGAKTERGGSGAADAATADATAAATATAATDVESGNGATGGDGASGAGGGILGSLDAGDTLAQVKAQAAALQAALARVAELSEVEQMPKVHAGFRGAFASVREALADVIDIASGGDGNGASSGVSGFFGGFGGFGGGAGKGDAEGWHILVTGHSLGGALATLTTLDFGRRFPKAQVTMYSFGAPRVGNTAFAELFSRVNGESFRVVNKRDLVARMPRGRLAARWMDYKHTGRVALVDEDNLGSVWVEGESHGPNPLSEVDPLTLLQAEASRSFLDAEMKLLDAMLSGEGLLHHLEDDYYAALSNVVDGPSDEAVRFATAKAEEATAPWAWPA